MRLLLFRLFSSPPLQIYLRANLLCTGKIHRFDQLFFPGVVFEALFYPLNCIFKGGICSRRKPYICCVKWTKNYCLKTNFYYCNISILKKLQNLLCSKKGILRLDQLCYHHWSQAEDFSAYLVQSETLFEDFPWIFG